MTTLYLVRHGQTDWNVLGRYQGHTDLPLNAVGQAQAQALARQLTGNPLAAIYSSDLRRARETAEVLAEALGLAVQPDPRLREMNLGAWEGQTVAEIVQRYPEAWAARTRDPLHARAPGGESVVEVAGRVTAAAESIAAVHPASQVLVVAHGVVLATLCCLARRQPLADVYNAIPDNGRPVIVRWPPG